MNGFGAVRARPGLARMGCTVSFICCEEDFLQMYQHEGEETAKAKLTKVRMRRGLASLHSRFARSQSGRVCLRRGARVLHAVFVFMVNMGED